MCEHGCCLSLCVPVMDWPPVQGILSLSPGDSLDVLCFRADRTQSTNRLPVLTKAVYCLNGDKTGYEAKSKRSFRFWQERKREC